MTSDHQASRTLVKSPPELWAECSDAASLARHIGEFGEIRITRLEPEKTVAWEGEHASGTVEIEPSGWGTRVTLTAQTKAAEVAPSQEPPVVSTGEDRIAEPEAERGAELEDERVPAPTTRHHPIEETADAKVEKTFAKPDLAVAASPLPARRWRHVIARTRRLWRPRLEMTPGAGPEANATAVEVAEPPAVDIAQAPPPEVAEPEVAEAPPPDSEATEAAADCRADLSIDTEAVLFAALDSLGQAHHRPFSRA